MKVNNPTPSTYEISLPGWSLSYIWNGDDSGITETDRALVDAWMASNPGLYSLASDESHFTWRPEFGLACDCYDVQVTPYHGGAK